MAAMTGSRNEARAYSTASITSRPFWLTWVTKGGSPGSGRWDFCRAPATITIAGTATSPIQPRYVRLW